MRLHLLILLFIIGFNPNVSNAGTLVGEWYLEDTKDAPNDERLAFSQPVSQSTDKTQVTLGLKSPGLTDVADFYLIAFNKVKGSNCQFTVSEVLIDAKSFAIKSANHSLEKSVIETRTKKDKTQLWWAFRKGNKMSLRIRQACSGGNVPGNEVNTFDFSLKGSGAAYKHVVGQKASVSLNQQKQKINKQVRSPKPEAVEATVKDTKTTVEKVEATVEDIKTTEKNVETTAEDIKTTEKNVETTVENESNYTIYILLFVGLLVAVLVIGFLKLRARPKSLDTSFVPDSEKPGPELGDSLQALQSTDSAENGPLVKPETYAATTPDMKQYIANIPRYKVVQVIDGDTITVSTLEDEKIIRLDSIDSPEDGQDWGGIAKDGLIHLIGDKHVHVEAHETDQLGRTIATLYVEDGNTSNWINVNEKMVELGHAWVMRQYYDHLPKDRRAELDKLESSAKLNKLGLWESLNPIPPWDWRKEN